MSKGQIKKIVKEFAELLRKNRIKFKEIYLFGSYATGKAHEYSDIDIAVIMRTLPRGMNYLKKKMQLRRLTPDVDSRIEPILLEAADLTESGSTIMGNEVRKHGILVVTGN